MSIGKGVSTVVMLTSTCMLLAATGADDGGERSPRRHGEGLRAADYDANTFVPPVARAGKTWTPTARIEVNYSGFPAAARQAFDYAVQIWEEHIESTMPINVSAVFESLENGVLGSAGPHLSANFTSSAARSNTWYPTALAEAITGRGISTSDTDISASFNSDFSNWYFGTDGRTPTGQYDFVTVVLHELGHGLGFTGSFNVEDADEEDVECRGSQIGDGCWGIFTSTGRDHFPIIFDRFVEDAEGISLLNTNAYPNPSIVLGMELQSGSVFFNGDAVRLVHGDVPVNLYAPDNFEPGSSFSHLDEQAFPPGTPSSLMTPFLGRAEAVHTPGVVTCAMFRDMGWPMGPGCQALFFSGLSDAEATRSGNAIRVTWRVGPSAGLDRVDVQIRKADDAFETFQSVDVDTSVLGTQSFTVQIPDLEPGRYDLRLTLLRTDGTTAPGPEFTITIPLDSPFFVTGPFPNPLLAGESGELRVTVREQQVVRVDAFSALGQRVATLHFGNVLGNDELRIPLNFTGMASGVYFLRITGSGFSTTRSVAVTR